MVYSFIHSFIHSLIYSLIHSFIYCVYRCVFQPSLFIVIPYTEIKFIKRIFLVAVKTGSVNASELSFYQVLYNQVIDENLHLKSKGKIFHILTSIVLLKSPSQTELNCNFKRKVYRYLKLIISS